MTTGPPRHEAARVCLNGPDATNAHHYAFCRGEPALDRSGSYPSITQDEVGLRKVTALCILCTLWLQPKVDKECVTIAFAQPKGAPGLAHRGGGGLAGCRRSLGHHPRRRPGQVAAGQRWRYSFGASAFAAGPGRPDTGSRGRHNRAGSGAGRRLVARGQHTVGHRPGRAAAARSPASRCTTTCGAARRSVTNTSVTARRQAPVHCHGLL